MRGKGTKKERRLPESVGQVATCHRCGKQKTVHPPYELAPDFRWFCSLACRKAGFVDGPLAKEVRARRIPIMDELDVRTAALLAELVAERNPGAKVSVEIVSEQELQRRIAEGGSLFRI